MMFGKKFFKNKEVTIDLEKKFLTLWETDKANLLFELERYPLKFFTARELIFTEDAKHLYDTYYEKTSKILIGERAFDIKLIFENLNFTIVQVKSVREVPITNYL